MRRRTLIAGLAVLLLAPQRPSAQQASAKIPRVGILSPEQSERTPKFDAFRRGSVTSAISKAATSSSSFG
jgi:hypothetical protein